MTSFRQGKYQKKIGRVLVVLSAFGLVTALLTFAGLLNSAQHASEGIFEGGHLGLYRIVIANQLTFAPLILPGTSFLKNRVMALPAIFSAFFLGIIPAPAYYYCLAPYYSYHLDRILELSPWNYGSVFALAVICLGLLLYHLHYSEKDG